MECIVGYYYKYTPSDLRLVLYSWVTYLIEI